jgi:hypothetical protein
MLYEVTEGFNPDVGRGLLSPEVEQVHSAFGIDADNGMTGKIAAVSGDSVIRSAIDPQRIESGALS